MARIDTDDGQSRFMIYFDYDADGIRTEKWVSGTTHSYVTQNGKVVRETISGDGTEEVLDFIYDESGRPFALNYSTNGGSSFTTYYYILNLQSDVVKLVNSSGTEYASYTYDAWGRILSTSGSLAYTNPLRYRGYYYDDETDFYYVSSRYYDPENGRFINADSYGSTGQGFIGTNMFVYCNNNPIIYSDDNGTIPMAAFPAPNGGGSKKEYEYINDQNDPTIGSLMLSDSVFSASVSHGGCGPVATYNALKTLGDPKDFEEVLSYYKSTSNTTILWGQLGMLPPAVGSYFVDAGYRVEGAWMSDSNYNALDAYASIADACILWYVFTTDSFPYYGAHFVEFSRVENAHQYIAHNAGGLTAENGVDTFQWVVDYAGMDGRIAAYGIFIFKE